MVIGSVIKDKIFGDGLFSISGDGTVDRQLNTARMKIVTLNHVQLLVLMVLDLSIMNYLALV